MSIEVDIEQALIDRVKVLGVFDPATLIKFPGLPFVERVDVRWLDVVIFRNKNGNPTWGDECIFYGILQLTINDPLQAGNIPNIAYASQLKDGFPKGTTMTSGVARVKVEEHPTIMSPLEGSPLTLLPVSIPWRCYNY